MTNEKHAPNEPMPLNDDELAKVAGGAFWDSNCEEELRQWCYYTGAELDTCIAKRYGQDAVDARKAWLDDGSRQGVRWWYGCDGIREEYY